MIYKLKKDWQEILETLITSACDEDSVKGYLYLYSDVFEGEIDTRDDHGDIKTGNQYFPCAILDKKPKSIYPEYYL